MNFSEHHYLRSLLGFLFGCMLLTSSFAQNTPKIGSLLTESEMAAAKAKPGIQESKKIISVLSAGGATVNQEIGKTIWVLSTGGSTTDPYTMVVNEQRAVGKSSNEVLITDSPTAQTKVKIAAYLPKAISVNYFDNMNATVLRFATLEEAAKACAALKTAMPEAQVSLPVTYSLLRTK